MQAINPTGSGPASAQSNAVTPLTAVVPAARPASRPTAATQSARVSWTAPASDGDSAITGYTVTPYIGSTAQATGPGRRRRPRSTTVTGLTNGTAYTFKVTATNGVGNSPASAASNAVNAGRPRSSTSPRPRRDDSGDPDARSSSA